MNDTPTQTTVNLTWNSTADAYYYQIFKNSTSLGYTQNTYWNDTGLTADTLYNYIVRANDSYNNWGQNSSNLSVETAQAIDITPPAGVTNLTNVTYAQTYINWTWTDPIQSNFSKVMIYLNGIFKTNVSKDVQYYNATGLTPETQHTISTLIVDTYGNISQTWVNNTASTALRVSPILECVADNGNGNYTANFGYKNPNNVLVSIPIGSANHFSPSPADRGQPTTFLPGRTPYYPNAAFSVIFDGTNLVWYLNGKTSTASNNSQQRCTPIITIISPINATYTTTNIPLNVSANEAVSTWLYSLNGGTNVTFIPDTTITAAQGANNIIIYANATNGTAKNWKSSQINFSVAS
jgi:hypothetical protein